MTIHGKVRPFQSWSLFPLLIFETVCTIATYYTSALAHEFDSKERDPSPVSLSLFSVAYVSPFDSIMSRNKLHEVCWPPIVADNTLHKNKSNQTQTFVKASSHNPSQTRLTPFPNLHAHPFILVLDNHLPAKSPRV